MPDSQRSFDAIVLGAGAAGLMCAATAGQRGRRVALLEHGGQAGRKILISGGGRCNFTNVHCGAGNFLSENKHFAKSALAGYGPRDFLALVERYGIRWHEKTLGQLFCDGSARAILDMLLAECAVGGVEVVLNARGIAVQKLGGGGFRVSCSAGEFAAESVVVATGGLSIPKMGATGLGYELARQFGLKVIEPRPGLVPLVLSGNEKAWTELAGVSAEVVAWVEAAASESTSLKGHGFSRAERDLDTDAALAAEGKQFVEGAFPQRLKPIASPADLAAWLKPRPFKAEKLAAGRRFAAPSGSAGSAVRFREKMLVTHRGVSGPAVLQASSYWRAGDALVLDLAPGLAKGAGLLDAMKGARARRDVGALKQALKEVLPQRLAGFLAETAGPKGWSNAALEECERELRRFKLHPVGTEGFEKAEVTAGGVDTDELQARTMEARKTPGLYFIGEVVDVTGWLGGFNFQWAWASGVAAGKAVYSTSLSR